MYLFRIYIWFMLADKDITMAKKGGETVKSSLAEMYFRKEWAVQEKKHVIGYCYLLLTRPQKQNRRTYWL